MESLKQSGRWRPTPTENRSAPPPSQSVFRLQSARRFPILEPRRGPMARPPVSRAPRRGVSTHVFAASRRFPRPLVAGRRASGRPAAVAVRSHHHSAHREREPRRPPRSRFPSFSSPATPRASIRRCSRRSSTAISSGSAISRPWRISSSSTRPTSATARLIASIIPSGSACARTLS